MRYLRAILFVSSVLILSNLHLMAQNATSSPSSRFGYGELSDNTPVAYRAIGGVSTGMRRYLAINPSQPASYTACDSMSFMFDIAGSVMWTNYQDQGGTRNRPNGNLEYVTVQFPIWKQHIAFSAGVLPYSAVGYDFRLGGSAGSHDYSVTYKGEGGISQVYGGLSFNIMDWVALGANFYYMFGDVTNATLLSFEESGITNSLMYRNMHIGSFQFRYGLQFFHTFAKKHEICLGAVFENKRKLSGEYIQYELYTMDSVNVTTDGFELPMYYSVGASYIYDHRLLVAFDYSRYDWSKALYFGERGAFADRSKISFGAEYRHNAFSRNYAHRMFWRVGASLQDSYVQELNSKDFAVSVGFGFPFRTTASMLNMTLEYNRRQSMKDLVENNLKFTIGIAVNENWFFKRKL